MSLLDVNVILAYYKSGKKVTVFGKDKIAEQKFDNKFVRSKIEELKGYQSSALHWNLALIENNLNEIVTKAIERYSKIQKSTGVELHSSQGLENFKNKIFSGYKEFMDFSRLKSSNASKREIKSKHKLEFLKTDTKAKITIKNYLGGLYNFTVDEAIIDTKYRTIQLIESKNSSKSRLPSKDDIKDGLLKMILYVNLQNVKIGDVNFSTTAILNLTSTQILSEFNSLYDEKSLDDSFRTNRFNQKEIELLTNLFVEAKTNNFIVTINKCI
jgi:hypothetical protein